MKSRKQNWRPIVGVLLLVLVTALSFGCKELTNNPPNEPSLSVDIQDIRQQLLNNTSEASYTAFDAPTNVTTLVLGALDLSSKASNFVFDPSSDVEGDDFKNSIIASISADYIIFVQMSELTDDQQYIEFTYPKSGEARWQVVAAAFTETITKKTVTDANDGGSTDIFKSISHAGYSESAYTADMITEDTIISVTMTKNEE